MNLYAPERQSAKAQKRWGPKGTTFWARVDKSKGEDSCWEWTGPTKNGYGLSHIRVGKVQTEFAHRRAFWYIKGSPKGFVIRHTCDNKLCCNPKHLLSGTHKDNARDRVERGLAKGGPKGPQHGSRNNAARITEAQAKMVLELHKNGIPQREIARKTGVKYPNVWCIVHGLSWNYLTGEKHGHKI